jgi:translocator protein
LIVSGMTTNTEHKLSLNSPRDAIAILLVFVAIAFLPAMVGSAFPPDSWYESLNKPSWDPPRWLFGPVWTVLYALIGYAGYLAWSSSIAATRYRAFSIYTVQLLLNALWSPLFFGYHSPGLALLNIWAQWIAIALNIGTFYRIKPAAGLLLLPYLLWVSFALILNGAIWLLNR